MEHRRRIRSGCCLSHSYCWKKYIKDGLAELTEILNVCIILVEQVQKQIAMIR
jgi:hypothetical protein